MAQLKQIKQDIAIGRPLTAKRVAGAIATRCEKLSENPYLARMIPEENDPQFREAFEHNYRIVLQVFPDGIRILKVEYAARERLPIRSS